MRALVALGALIIALGSYQAKAGDVDTNGGGHNGGNPHCPDCKPDTKKVCFNVVCHIENFDDNDWLRSLAADEQPGVQGDGHDGNHGKPRRCTVAATFTKKVTKEGGEVTGDSRQDLLVLDDEHKKDDVRFEVECDGKWIFKNSAYIFGNLLGTRIQAEQGPTPALLLPRGTLHSGANNSAGEHYTKAILELDNGKEFIRGKGTCQIWTGFP